MEEIFKEIKGYEGLYKISNYGRVKNKDKILKLYHEPNRYYSIGLFKQGARKTFRIHRLVAQAFVDNPENNNEVNHKDGDKTNNNASNLEYVTHKMNSIHAKENNLSCKGSRCGSAKLSEYDVLYIKDRLKKYKHGMYADLAKKYNVCIQTICSIKTGESWAWL